MWPLLEHRLGRVTLNENHRALEPWAQDAWTALRDGAAPRALIEFERRGLIELEATRVEARLAAVAR